MDEGDRVENKTLKGVDAVVFRDDGRVLMLHRDDSRESFKTGWEFVKGAMKWGETPLDAALREIAEEAGIQVRLLGSTPRSYIVDARYRKSARYEFIEKAALVFLYLGGDVRIDPREHTEARWMLFDEAVQMVWVEFGSEILLDARSIFQQWLSARGEKR